MRRTWMDGWTPYKSVWCVDQPVCLGSRRQTDMCVPIQRERRCQSSAQQKHRAPSHPDGEEGGAKRIDTAAEECWSVSVDFCPPTRAHQSVHPHQHTHTHSQAVSPICIDTLRQIQRETEEGYTDTERGERPTDKPTHTHQGMSTFQHTQTQTQPAIRSIVSTSAADPHRTASCRQRGLFAALRHPPDRNTHTHTEREREAWDQPMTLQCVCGAPVSAERVCVCIVRAMCCRRWRPSPPQLMHPHLSSRQATPPHLPSTQTHTHTHVCL